LLVDFANRLRHAGYDQIAAVRESALERFRPIIMTTCAMIAGMLPLALALDPGSQAERSLGTVVIGGLSSSLLLTLVLVPIVYLRFSPPPRHTETLEEILAGVPGGTMVSS
jgi:HAE1 family hydrophobic/amphiphilic exporter-1